MLCSISGEVPKEPVVSVKSGHVFEKSLIEKFIGEHFKCPITGTELSLTDLLPLQTTFLTAPRPPNLSSIPSLLSLFQNEWDASTLEMFTLKKKYKESLQELSHALYQHDAACRVIARLIKERDAAREALLSLKEQQQLNGNEMQVEDNLDQQQQQEEEEKSVFSADLLNLLTETASTLSKERKKKKHQDQNHDLSTFKPISSVSPLGNITSSNCILSACPLNRSLVALSSDKNIVIYNTKEQKTVATMKTHTKKINSFSWCNNNNNMMLLSGSVDKTVRGWQESESSSGNTAGKWSNAFTFKFHQSEVVAVCAHPVSDYFLSVETNGKWSFNQISTLESIVSVVDLDKDGKDVKYTCGMIHPDGLVFATGDENGKVKIWDLKSQKVVFEFDCDSTTTDTTDTTAKNDNSVQMMTFSENGYYFACACNDNNVGIWDLRKLVKVKQIELPSTFKVNKMKFDIYGKYFGLVGSDIRLYVPKQWEQVAQFGKGEEGEVEGDEYCDFEFVNEDNSELIAITKQGHLTTFSTN